MNCLQSVSECACEERSDEHGHEHEGGQMYEHEHGSSGLDVKSKGLEIQRWSASTGRG